MGAVACCEPWLFWSLFWFLPLFTTFLNICWGFLNRKESARHAASARTGHHNTEIRGHAVMHQAGFESTIQLCEQPTLALNLTVTDLPDNVNEA